VDPAALGRVLVLIFYSFPVPLPRDFKSRNHKCHQQPAEAAGSTFPDCHRSAASITPDMIRKLKSGEYRLYSRKKNVKTGKRRNLGTFSSRQKAEAHERAVQYFKRH
jgi:hypothetical protein